MAPVAEALTAGQDATAALVAVAGDYAERGEALELVLHDLDQCLASVVGGPADPGSVRLAALSWSEQMLARFGRISCEDPMTGLATLPHLRSRLADLYRRADVDGVDLDETHQLILVDLSCGDRSSAVQPAFARLAGAMRMAVLCDEISSVFDVDETIARVAETTVAVIVQRADHHPRQVAEMVLNIERRLRLAPGRYYPTVRVERFPPDLAAALMLVSEPAGVSRAPVGNPDTAGAGWIGSTGAGA